MSVIHRPMRMLTAAMLAGLSLLISQRAAADCRVNPLVGFVPQNIDVDVGEISVPTNLPVGGVILTRSYPVITKSSNTFRCDAMTGRSSRLIFYSGWPAGWAPGLTSVFLTQVPGIGMRIRQTVIVAGGGQRDMYYTADVIYSPFQSFGIPSSNVVVELIKTSASVGSGPVAPNGLFAGQQVYGIDRPILSLSIIGGGGLSNLRPASLVRAVRISP